MVTKCANPGCSAPFLYLRQGKLFRIETVDTQSDQGASFGMDPIAGRAARHLEFFWLCDDCAPLMTVAVKRGRGVIVQTLARDAVASIESAPGAGLARTFH
jgi:hypothetical protein